MDIYRALHRKVIPTMDHLGEKTDLQLYIEQPHWFIFQKLRKTQAKYYNNNYCYKSK